MLTFWLLILTGLPSPTKD